MKRIVDKIDYVKSIAEYLTYVYGRGLKGMGDWFILLALVLAAASFVCTMRTQLVVIDLYKLGSIFLWVLVGGSVFSLLFYKWAEKCREEDESEESGINE